MTTDSFDGREDARAPVNVKQAAHGGAPPIVPPQNRWQQDQTIGWWLDHGADPAGLPRMASR